MWICSFLSVYVLLLGFSICSQKHYIGYSIHSMNGMLLITSMTFYLFSLLALTCPHILFSSTKFCRHLGCRKLLRKIQMVVSSFILDLSSIPARWKSLSLPTKSNARSMPSAFSYRPHRYRSPFSRRPLVFCLTAVKLFLSVVLFYATFSLSSVTAISRVEVGEFEYPVLQKLTSNGGNVFYPPGPQSH